MARRQLEIGVSFELHDIEAFAKSKGYDIDLDGAVCSIYNYRGQYTEFQYYNNNWYCTAKWFRITNPRHKYYIRTNEDTEIYE